MAKDPAFLFYPNDYLGGTLGMTFEEKGAYIELLMTQFNRGHMTSHMIGHIVGHIWDTIQTKFIQDEDGNWYNKRLEEEQQKRKAYSDSRKKNISGINQYSKKDNSGGHISGHMTSHMENENVNENKDKSEKEKKVKIEKSKTFSIPNLQEIKDYFKEKGYTEESAIKFFNYYSAGDWADGKGQKIRNWKMKAVGVWFKEENKIPPKKDATMGGYIKVY